MQIDVHADRAMIAQAKGQHRPAPRRPWLALLSAVLELAGGKAELIRHAERTWASATFSGTRHTIVLAFAGNDAEAAGEVFLEALPDHEFAIPGQLVADAGIVRTDHALLPAPRLEVEVELLLLDDC